MFQLPSLSLPAMLAAACVTASAFQANAQAASVRRAPLDIAAWHATDSIGIVTHLGRPSVYINRGVALWNDADFRDGVIDFDMAASARSTFLGVVFHARATDNAEVVFFRFGSSGAEDAIQYAPALNSITAAWQVFHGSGANAAANLPREQWIPVRVVVAGEMASVFVGDTVKPALIVPRLAGTEGKRLGIWAGGFGRGAFISNLRYSRSPASAAHPVASPLPAGTIRDWEISEAVDASSTTPGSLPDLNTLRWEPVRAEPPGIVLVNRYRVAPIATLPVDPTSRTVLRDSVMTGRVPGAKVVFARTIIHADRAEYRRLHFGFSDGAVIYANGQPLFFGMNPQFFRGQGEMEYHGQAVYIPLRSGRNEIVFAVTEFTGGWAFFGRWDR